MAAKSSSKPTTKRTTKRPPANAAAETTSLGSVETTNASPTTASPTTASPTTTSMSTRAPSRDEIAHRAFELFIARGRQHGRAQEDWLSAERELRARYSVN
jgi:hypothetical protein